MTEKGRIRFDYNNMMKEYVGDRGFTDEELESYRNISKRAFDMVQSNRGKGMTGWTELPYNQDEIAEEIIACAKKIRAKYDNFVVLGIGGSALGPMALFQALCHLRHNELPKEKRNAPKFYVEDNVDPERMSALLDVIDVKKTMFNVITKSGSTSETMSQYLIISDILRKKLGGDFASHIVATTSEKTGNLIKIAKKEGYETFFIPDGVGGRFSELSPVGLLPAAVLGIDIKLFLKGAKYMDKCCGSDNYVENPALIAALLQYVAIKKGCNISVMMPYSDGLKLMADWYAQLWGESLGKAVDLQGGTVNAGQTPVKALGVTDQHSQIQLYVEGPFDKVITLIGVDDYRKTVLIPEGCVDIPAVNFLCGHTLNELIIAEMNATEYALTESGRLNSRITLPEINAHTMGQLMFFFMLQTAYIGAMLNVDAFNQPGVEGGKNAAYALLGREGYEEKRSELEKAKQKSKKYIV